MISTVQLFREIGLSSSTFLVVGNIIGVGIFTTSGLIAERVGDSVWILGVWVLGGLLALMGATCYSVLVRHTPKAGGEYAFLYPTYGPLPAFLSGWASLLIGFSAPIAAASLGLAYYLEPYVPPGFAGTQLAIKGIAATSLIVVSLFISLGLRFGAQLHSLVTFLNIGLIIGFSMLVLVRAPLMENLQPILTSSAFEVSLPALGGAIILVMFGYSGWNAAAYVAEEVRSPHRNVPAALLTGTGAVIVAYLLVNLAYFGGAPIETLRGEIAVAEITASRVFGSAGSSFVSILILSSILSSLTAMSIAGPRVYFAMSRDRLFPEWLSRVDPRRKIPVRAIWFQSGIAMLLILVARFNQILLYAGTILIVFSTLTVSVLLRTGKSQATAKPFWLFYRVLPGAFTVVNAMVLLGALASSWMEAVAGGLTVAAGLPVFYHYRNRKRKEQRVEEQAGTPRDAR